MNNSSTSIKTLIHSLNTIKNSSKALYDDVIGHAYSTSSHAGKDNFFIINSRIFVEIQAQIWPDRLDKPRTGSVRPDRCVNRLFKPVRKPVRNKRPDRCENREAVGKIFREGIYLGVSVGAHL